jgi:hypothetical protein
MNHRLRVSLFTLILLVTMFACNLPVEQVPPPGDIQTAAALTVQAVIAAPSSTKVVSQVLAAGTPSLTATGLATQTITVTITPTYSAPMLTVRENTNCRTGPGENYQVVFTYTS